MVLNKIFIQVNRFEFISRKCFRNAHYLDNFLDFNKILNLSNVFSVKTKE